MEIVMKRLITTVRAKPLLILSVLLLLTLESAFAQVTAEKTEGNVPAAISENSDTHLNDSRPAMDEMDRNILNELLHADSTDKTEPAEKEDLNGSGTATTVSGHQQN